MEVARFMDKIDYLACPALDLGCSHVGAFHKEQLFLLRPTASLFFKCQEHIVKIFGVHPTPCTSARWKLQKEKD